MPKAQSQADKRREGTFRDQHDRAYHATMEKDTGDAVWPLQPKFDAPLVFPSNPAYVQFRADEPQRFRIRYDQWLADLAAANTERTQNLRRYAQMMFGDKAGEAIANPPASLLDLVGPEPFPMLPVQAAAQENGYVLGLRPFDPTREADVRIKQALDDYTARRFPHQVPARDAADYLGDDEPDLDAAVAAVVGATEDEE